MIEKSPVRDFIGRDGRHGRVCDAKCIDDSGDNITLTLWNEDIEQVEADQKIKITSGWVGEWNGKLQISKGRNGRLEVLE